MSRSDPPVLRRFRQDEQVFARDKVQQMIEGMPFVWECRIAPGQTGPGGHVGVAALRAGAAGAQDSIGVKPSALQRSLPTPWCAKKRPVGSTACFTASNRG